MLQKPKFGMPCNGCGYCCREEVCAIGKEIYGHEQSAPCPALLKENGRYWCSFVLAEDMLRRPSIIGNALGIGKGCCADDSVFEEELSQ